MPVPALPTFPKVTAKTITSHGNTPKMNASLTGYFIKVLEKMQLFKKCGAGFWSLLLLGMAVNAMVNIITLILLGLGWLLCHLL